MQSKMKPALWFLFINRVLAFGHLVISGAFFRAHRHSTQRDVVGLQSVSPTHQRHCVRRFFDHDEINFLLRRDSPSRRTRLQQRSNHQQRGLDPHRQSTFKTIFPNSSRFSMRWWASAHFSSGRTMSITGFSKPRRSNSSAENNSALLPMNEPRIVRWRVNRYAMLIAPSKPVVAPQVTRRPPTARLWMLLSHVAWPTCSNTTSTPRRLVKRFTSSAIFCVVWLITASAPSSLAFSSFASEPAVAMTRAPAALAI